MYLVECAPIQRGLRKETLSYFSKDEPSIGSVISVPLRNKKVPALIIKSLPLSEEKMAVKGAAFALKKLAPQKGVFLFFKETIAAAEDTARFFTGPVGSILESFTPQAILESTLRLTSDRKKGGKYFGRTLQAGIEERILEYRTVVRERFAKDESVLLVVPTIEEVIYFHSELVRGIEKYSHPLHSGLSKKEILSTWKKILSQSHPVLIITTPFGLSVPRGDIGAIIVERENSRSYASLRAPYPDGRIFAQFLAKQYKCQCVYADTTLRVETLHKEQLGEFDPFPASKLRVGSSANSVLTDMKKNDLGEKKEFAVLSDEAKQLISYGLLRNERVVVFAARTGVAPITLCGDCGAELLCGECNSPFVLHKKADSFYYLCHRCGERAPAERNCKFCGSWNLRPLGIGIDRVAEEIRNEFPEASVILLSKEHLKTNVSPKMLVEDFYRAPRTILLGTEYMIPFLQKSYEHTIVASLDSLFAVPDFKINEKVFNFLSILRHLSTRNFLLQTRNAGNFVIQTATRGDTASFYREEIEQRRIFHFPPFTTIIKITIEGEKEKVSGMMKEIMDSLGGYDFSVFPAFVPGKGAARALSALIRLPKGAWVDEKLLEILRSLPPFVRIEVNPDTIV